MTADPLAGLTRIIAARRMTRRFDGSPLPDGLLDRLLDTARRAPTAGFSQGCHFLALQGPALQRWWELTVEPGWADRIAAGVGRAGAVVIPVADPVAYTTRYAAPDKQHTGLAERSAWPVPFWLTDTAMATQNLLLLAEAAGLGALLYGLFGTERAVLQDTFGVPETMEPLGVVALGGRSGDDRPSGSPTRRPRRPTAEVVHHDHW